MVQLVSFCSPRSSSLTGTKQGYLSPHQSPCDSQAQRNTAQKLGLWTPSVRGKAGCWWGRRNSVGPGNNAFFSGAEGVVGRGNLDFEKLRPKVHCREGLATSCWTVVLGSRRFVDAWLCWESLWLETWWLGCVMWRHCACALSMSLSQVDGVILRSTMNMYVTRQRCQP